MATIYVLAHLDHMTGDHGEPEPEVDIVGVYTSFTDAWEAARAVESWYVCDGPWVPHMSMHTAHKVFASRPHGYMIGRYDIAQSEPTPVRKAEEPNWSALKRAVVYLLHIQATDEIMTMAADKKREAGGPWYAARATHNDIQDMLDALQPVPPGAYRPRISMPKE